MADSEVPAEVRTVGVCAGGLECGAVGPWCGGGVDGFVMDSGACVVLNGSCGRLGRAGSTGRGGVSWSVACGGVNGSVGQMAGSVVRGLVDGPMARGPAKVCERGSSDDTPGGCGMCTGVSRVTWVLVAVCGWSCGGADVGRTGTSRQTGGSCRGRFEVVGMAGVLAASVEQMEIRSVREAM